MKTYKTLVTEAAEKYADWHVDLSDPEADEESMKEHAFCSNHCASVLESPVVKELIEQIAREAQLNNCPEILIKKGQISYYHTPFNCDWWAKFMGGEDGDKV
jgi:hypothetical protein